MATLLDVVQSLETHEDAAVILLPSDAVEVGPATPVVVIVPPPGCVLRTPADVEAMGPAGFRLLIDVKQARLAIKLWKQWGDGSEPGPEKAVEIVVMLAKVSGGLNPAFQNVEDKVQRAIRERSCKMDLRSLGLSTLPDRLVEMEWLETLDLSDNELAELSGSIGRLTKLRRLKLRRNRLRQLPDSMGEFKSLIWLDLGENQLTMLPEAIGDLKELVDLDLKNNRLVELPRSLGRLERLLRIDPRGNPFCRTRFPWSRSYLQDFLALRRDS